MKIYRPLWNEGVLLSPQQFQQQSAMDNFIRAGVSALTSPYPWGVERAELDEHLLSFGRIQFTALRLWLQDGTLVDTQNCDPGPDVRELDEQALSGRDAVTVLLGLPLMQPGMVNVQSEGVVSGQPLRFREEWIPVPDMFGQEEESIAVARLNLSVRYAHENNAAWLTCPVARLVRDKQGGWHRDPDFIPPMALFSASTAMCERLSLLNRQLRSRRTRLMSMRRESNARLADFAVADVSLFWLLNALNAHARVLTRYEHQPQRPPERVWAELTRLAGSMLTFSLEHEPDVIPEYYHDDPARTFPPLFDLIAELLETSLPSRVVALDMSRPDEQTWKATFHDIRLREEADFWLSVRSDIPLWQLAEQFPGMCKAGSPDDVRTISSLALAGIPLMPVSRVPAALPVRLENQYFAMDMDNPAARAMLEQGVCLFYVPALLGAVELELFAVLRS
ncbi:type VI secretion system baseplate subunit TssK [Enterobacter asburiae]|uniref:type VI secretion system baseplate subunit TssK n=1 Tax=Enterobacter asburiae TaxID=61645 RepID=UPI003F56BCDD